MRPFRQTNVDTRMMQAMMSAGVPAWGGARGGADGRRGDAVLGSRRDAGEREGAQVSHVREDVEESHEPGSVHEGFWYVRLGVPHFLSEKRHVVPRVGREERADGSHGERPQEGNLEVPGRGKRPRNFRSE